MPGDFDVVNFRDVSVESDLDDTKKAIFDFEFDPVARLSTSLGYALRLTWSRVSGLSSGVIEGGNCKYYRQPNAQLEQVGHTGTYRLNVPLSLLGNGRLLVNLTINLSCHDWQIRGTSDSLEISAKRG